jgi:hypothetical protein
MPSSPRKIASARANAAKSRGPATDAGKQSSALNAVAHGLTARTIVLFNESADEYQIQLRDYLDHFRPQTKPEADLVHQLASAHWRVARYAGVESGFLEHRMQDQQERLSRDYDDVPENHRLAIAFEALSGANSSLALLNRYQSRLHHEYQRLLKTLLQMQSVRAEKPQTAKLPNEPNPVSEHSADAPLLPFAWSAASHQQPATNNQPPIPNP